MERRLTEQDGRLALQDHAREKAMCVRRKYGDVTYEAMLRILDDRDAIRFPTEIRFSAGALEPGEFAYAQPLGPHPRDGYCVHVHPWFMGREDDLPLLIAYHLARVNYGESVTHVESEIFGAALLGLDVDAYYQRLCEMSDELLFVREPVCAS